MFWGRKKMSKCLKKWLAVGGRSEKYDGRDKIFYTQSVRLYSDILASRDQSIGMNQNYDEACKVNSSLFFFMFMIDGKIILKIKFWMKWWQMN